MRARARKTRCCWPPESWLICRWARWGDADLLERLHRPFGLGGVDAAEPAEAAVGSHGNDIEGVHGEIPVDALALRHVGDPVAGLAVGHAIDVRPSRGARDQVEAGLEQGALAGSVRPDDADELALGDVQLDVPENWLPLIGDGEVVDREGNLRRVLGAGFGVFGREDRLAAEGFGVHNGAGGARGKKWEGKG